MDNLQDSQRYFFKLIYEKLWQMLIYATTYFNTPVNKRLNMYYEQFRKYLLTLSALQDFDSWQDIVHKLPANLLNETLYDYLDTWHELQNEGNKGLEDLQSLNVKPVTLPDWLSEAVQNIDGWTVDPLDLDKSVSNDAFESLALGTKQVNKQVKGKLVIHKDGKAEFYAPSGKVYYTEIQRNTNEYRLLEYMSKDVGNLIATSDLAKKLKSPRQERDGVDYSRRVLDVLHAVKDKLFLPNIETLFLVNRGYYGLKYPVEL